MNLPDGRPLVVDDGNLAESASAAGRFVLWIRGEHLDGLSRWDRVVPAAGAEVTIARGVCAIAAVATPVQQRAGSGLGKILGWLVKRKGEPTWTLSKGVTVERCGARRVDLVLAWGENEARPLDEAQVKAHWPGCREVCKIGPGLYLVSGVETTRVAASPVPADLPPESPIRPLAEAALAAARRDGAPPREVTALIDLSVALLNENQAQPAWSLLNEALDKARALGDHAREIDATLNLGRAASQLNRPAEAIEILVPALARAREAGTAYDEIVALERLGHAFQSLGDSTRALDHFEQAAEIARKLGDARHLAKLLWYAAIQHAEAGRVDQAIARGEETVQLLRRLNQPDAAGYAEQLASYRAGSLLAAPLPVGGTTMAGGAISTSVLTTNPQPQPARHSAAASPGILRMALSAAGSMARFAGAGFQTVSPAAYQTRLAQCAGCEHYTGLRCRVCGCIMVAKARLAHEICPAGKWQGEVDSRPYAAGS
jgi:tetratricopeptide (TPR) repeat protein